MVVGDSMTQILLKPIGVVKNHIKAPAREDWSHIVSEIVVNPELTEALESIESFSHIIVVYWMHKLPAREPVLRVHPRGRGDLPLRGTLATRSPMRPNPLGVTVAKLIEHDQNVLTVSGLDAIDGTPVLDIKPHLPNHDAPQEFKVPGWAQ